MERLSIEEIIKHCKRKREAFEKVNGAEMLETKDISNTFIKEYWEHRQVAEYLLELQQYRSIGTVEEIQNNMKELARWHSDRLNSRIKNDFACMSTLICHNCDHKDEYIEELDAEIEEYKSIGTVEECRAAAEKQRAKKRKLDTYCGFNSYECPVCGREPVEGSSFCHKCGQRLE